MFILFIDIGGNIDHQFKLSFRNKYFFSVKTIE